MRPPEAAAFLRYGSDTQKNWEAILRSDTLGALAATLYTTGLRTTTGCTDRAVYVRRTYVRRTDCYCGQARLLLGYVLSYCLPSVVILTLADGDSLVTPFLLKRTISDKVQFNKGINMECENYYTR